MFKNWTILIYANGNNELEPEMWQAKFDAEKTGSDLNVNVVMLIGRESRQLTSVLRPTGIIPDTGEQWTGVKRYYIKKNHSDLIGDLGSINMAHPGTLYDFIRWGMENYPARHYILILGGHALQFVGMMTDYSQEAPYIMGLPEMTKALDLIKKDTGKTIDILALDTCHMNSVEVIFELGYEEDHAVQNVITFVGEGPIAGLPYDRLIDLVRENADNDVAAVTKQIIDGLQLDLVAFEVNRQKLLNIKKAVHEHACNLLSYHSDEEAVIRDLPRLDNELASIITHHKCVSQKKYLITLAAKMVRLLEPFYYRLAFARNNDWTRLLLNKQESADCPANVHIKLEPINLPREALYLYIRIMNPSLDQKQVETILQALLCYKNWYLD